MARKYEHQTPENTWIVVANRAKARIFDTVWPELPALEEVASLVHPEATLKVRDTVSDAPGRFKVPVSAPHSGEPRTDFAHQMTQEFAQQLVEHLEAHRLAGDFGAVMLIAPPLMLAALRKQMDRPLAELVTEELDKDYSELPDRELQERLSALARTASVS
jgi:protein required for attachment to host cells